MLPRAAVCGGGNPDTNANAYDAEGAGSNRVHEPCHVGGHRPEGELPCPSYSPRFLWWHWTSLSDFACVLESLFLPENCSKGQSALYKFLQRGLATICIEQIFRFFFHRAALGLAAWALKPSLKSKSCISPLLLDRAISRAKSENFPRFRS